VLRGATRLFMEKRIKYLLMEFIVEFIEDMNEDPYLFVNSLEKSGYALHAIEPDGQLGKRLDPATLVDERRVPAEGPMRSIEEINVVAVLQD
jgi:hypothetical protein